MRLGISWPMGRGRRMWLSGGPLAWLVGYLLFCLFGVLWLAAWIVVAVVQLLIVIPVRAVARRSREGRAQR